MSTTVDPAPPPGDDLATVLGRTSALLGELGENLTEIGRLIPGLADDPIPAVGSSVSMAEPSQVWHLRRVTEVKAGDVMRAHDGGYLTVFNVHAATPVPPAGIGSGGVELQVQRADALNLGEPPKPLYYPRLARVEVLAKDRRRSANVDQIANDDDVAPSPVADESLGDERFAGAMAVPSLPDWADAIDGFDAFDQAPLMEEVPS